MSAIAEEIAPPTLAQKRIVLSLPQGAVPRAGGIVLIDVDYTGADADDGDGLVLPLIFSVTQPDGSKLIPPRLLKLFTPRRLAFQPETSGNHLVRIGEAFHNRSWGSLVVQVLGDQAPGAG